jgi:hypothetical protein
MRGDLQMPPGGVYPQPIATNASTALISPGYETPFGERMLPMRGHRGQNTKSEIKPRLARTYCIDGQPALTLLTAETRPPTFCARWSPPPFPLQTKPFVPVSTRSWARRATERRRRQGRRELLVLEKIILNLNKPKQR